MVDPVPLFLVTAVVLLTSLAAIGLHGWALWRFSQVSSRFEDKRLLYLWLGALGGLFLGPFTVITQPLACAGLLWLRRQLNDSTDPGTRVATRCLIIATGVTTLGLWLAVALAAALLVDW